MKIEERKIKIFEEQIEEIFFSDKNLLNNNFKLKVNSDVPNPVQITKGSNQDKNTSINDSQ